jgi:hypothetical protein
MSSRHEGTEQSHKAGKNLRPIQSSRSSAGGAKAVGDLSIYLLSLE